MLAAPPVRPAQTRAGFAAQVAVQPTAEVKWGDADTNLAGNGDCAALRALLSVAVPEGTPLLYSCSSESSAAKPPLSRHRLVVTLKRLDTEANGGANGPGGPGADDPKTLTVDF